MYRLIAANQQSRVVGMRATDIVLPINGADGEELTLSVAGGQRALSVLLGPRSDARATVASGAAVTFVYSAESETWTAT
jgi:hypothetical protein